VPHLSVNIDHVATVRQARRTWEPDPLAAALEAQQGGAHGITVHLREDRRHIQDADVDRLRSEVSVPLHLEMAVTAEMVAIARRIRPATAMLVPEGRLEVTTEGGLDIVASESRVRDAVRALADAGIPCSIFIDADLRQVEAAARVGARIGEVHTGPYAHAVHAERGLGARAQAELARVRAAGDAIVAAGMSFNAGHALHYENVSHVAALPGLHELHIGHAIVSRAVISGMRQAVSQMLAAMAGAHG
jgi:pyridoxine 5-phosphate synthase